MNIFDAKATAGFDLGSNAFSVSAAENETGVQTTARRYPVTASDVKKRNFFVATQGLPHQHRARLRELFAGEQVKRSSEDLVGGWHLLVAPQLPAVSVFEPHYLARAEQLNARATQVRLRDEPLHIEKAEPEVVQVKPISDGRRAFEPSRELLSIWIDGLNQNYREAGIRQLDPKKELLDTNSSAELSRQIRKVINNFAQRKAYEGGSYRITFGHNLIPTVQNLLLDHLMLPPLVATPFFTELTKLLYEHSDGSPTFKGRWGELIIDDIGELVLVLTKRKRRSLDQMIKG